MHFSLTAIALAAVSIVSGAELDTRDLTCLAGRRFTTFNNLPNLLPLTSISQGQVSVINNYYDLNYTNFAAGNIGQGVGDNALYYALSRLGTGSWNWWQNNVFGLVGFNGRLPIASFPPSIVGSNRNVNFRITRFSYGCGIQQIANSVAFVPFDCQVIIRPIEPSRRNQVHVCRFSASPSNGALQSCRPNLPIGRGFTFQTVGRIPNRAWLTRWRSLFNNNLPSFILTAIDNLAYTEYCSFP